MSDEDVPALSTKFCVKLHGEDDPGNRQEDWVQRQFDSVLPEGFCLAHAYCVGVVWTDDAQPLAVLSSNMSNEHGASPFQPFFIPANNRAGRPCAIMVDGCVDGVIGLDTRNRRTLHLNVAANAIEARCVFTGKGEVLHRFICPGRPMQAAVNAAGTLCFQADEIAYWNGIPFCVEQTTLLTVRAGSSRETAVGTWKGAGPFQFNFSLSDHVYKDEFSLVVKNTFTDRKKLYMIQALGAGGDHVAVEQPGVVDSLSHLNTDCMSVWVLRPKALNEKWRQTLFPVPETDVTPYMHAFAYVACGDQTGERSAIVTRVVVLLQLRLAWLNVVYVASRHVK